MTSAMYFSVERLSDVDHLYQFSLRTFLAEIADKVLVGDKSGGGGVTAAAQAGARLRELTAKMFAACYTRVLLGLRGDDRLLLAVRLAQIRVGGARRRLKKLEHTRHPRDAAALRLAQHRLFHDRTLTSG